MAESFWRAGMCAPDVNGRGSGERAANSASQNPGLPVDVLDAQPREPSAAPARPILERPDFRPEMYPALAPAGVKPTAPWLLRKRALSEWEHRICDRVTQLRCEWKLSQLQLARLLNTTVRSVKRWEAHRCKPTERQRQLLGSLLEYVKTNGLTAFMGRFVREEPRYRKPGPADRSAENAFDSKVARESPSAFVES